MEANKTGAPEGWLGVGRGSHAWGDARRLGSGGSEPNVSPEQSGNLPSSQAVSYALRGPLQATLVLGA